MNVTNNLADGVLQAAVIGLLSSAGLLLHCSKHLRHFCCVHCKPKGAK